MGRVDVRIGQGAPIARPDLVDVDPEDDARLRHVHVDLGLPDSVDHPVFAARDVREPREGCSRALGFDPHGIDLLDLLADQILRDLATGQGMLDVLQFTLIERSAFQPGMFADRGLAATL